MWRNIIIFISKQTRTQLSSTSNMLLTRTWAKAKSTACWKCTALGKSWSGEDSSNRQLTKQLWSREDVREIPTGEQNLIFHCPSPQGQGGMNAQSCIPHKELCAEVDRREARASAESQTPGALAASTEPPSQNSCLTHPSVYRDGNINTSKKTIISHF